MRSTRIWIGMVILILLGARSSPATEATSSEWPLERIISNLEARLIESPEDAITHYNLGRAHGFAFALGRSSLWATGRDSPDWVMNIEHQRRRAKRPPEKNRNDKVPLDLPPPSPSQLLDNLTQGVRHLLRACELGTGVDVGDLRFELTTAWLLETGAHLASRVDTLHLFQLDGVELAAEEAHSIDWLLKAWIHDRTGGVLPRLIEPGFLEKVARYCAEHSVSTKASEQATIDAFLRRYWLEKAIEHYRLACQEPAQWMKQMGRNSVAEKSVAEEAYRSYMRLVGERGFRNAAEENASRELEALLQELETLPRVRGTSPVLLSLDGCHSLDELIAPDLTVPFDLDGDAIDELWPWIAPGTGWLVWDPHRRGEITSGLQLFGTASAWLFFPDGYRVLDALDDDRDDRLSGAELAGIAVWFDRDSDGISDRGEVIPVEDLGIVALARRRLKRPVPRSPIPAASSSPTGACCPPTTGCWKRSRSSARRRP